MSIDKKFFSSQSIETSEVLGECIRIQDAVYRYVAKDHFQKMLQHILRFPEIFIEKHLYQQLSLKELSRFSLKLSQGGSWGNGVFIDFQDIHPGSNSQIHLTGEYNITLFYEDICICTCGIVILGDRVIVSQLQASCLDEEKNNFIVAQFDWVAVLLDTLDTINGIALRKPLIEIHPRPDLDKNAEIYSQRPKKSGFTQKDGMLQKPYYSIDGIIAAQRKKYIGRSTEVDSCGGCFNFIPDVGGLVGECMYDLGRTRGYGDKNCPDGVETVAITEAERLLRFSGDNHQIRTPDTLH